MDKLWLSFFPSALDKGQPSCTVVDSLESLLDLYFDTFDKVWAETGTTYNYWDLNRVNKQINYIFEELSKDGYDIKLAHAPETNYEMTDFIKVSDINMVRENIKTIVALLPVIAQPCTPNPARLQVFGHKEANVIESNLKALLYTMIIVREGWKYAGTFSSGQIAIL